MKKEKINSVVKTYAIAKAAYEEIIEMIKEELNAMPDYQEAKAKLTIELRETDRKEYDRLELFVIEKEVELEMKYRRFDLYMCLDEAEKLMITAFGKFISRKKQAAASVKELFAKPMIDDGLHSREWRAQAIQIILATPEF